MTVYRPVTSRSGGQSTVNSKVISRFSRGFKSSSHVSLPVASSILRGLHGRVAEGNLDVVRARDRNLVEHDDPLGLVLVILDSDPVPRT